ncbi:hypothetical protein B0H21DRAFT_738308 [Amylocystis lapponica]|nr:hypothetical protein B0H21DRAFT_738308 [Amylocystis lapponica]
MPSTKIDAAVDAVHEACGGSKALKPTTSLLTNRYTTTGRVNPGHSTIAPGLFCYAGEREPEYLPLGWTAHIHPEGKVYFACDATLKIVTEAYMYSRAVQEKIVHWTGVINELLFERHISLPDTAELFVELDDATESCLYYFVDHAAQTEFWLEELSTEFLDLPPAISESHLRLALEELYWNHVEHFPSHRSDQVSLRVDELTTAFVHARADHMTSEYSTFPYGAEECTNFLSVIRAARDYSKNAYSISVIAHHRFTTHYGQEHARLSRDQSILDTPPPHRRWLFTSFSRLLFSVPSGYAQQLDELFVDGVVYTHQWRSFASACRDEWKLYASWVSLPMLAINVLLLLIPSTCRAIALASILLCNVAIVFAATLLTRNHRAADWLAAEAATYLADARGESCGFHPIAVAYSLPKALFLWALASNFYACAVVIVALVGLSLCTGRFPCRASCGVDFRRPAFFSRLLPRWCSGSVSLQCEV